MGGSAVADQPPHAAASRTASILGRGGLGSISASARTAIAVAVGFGVASLVRDAVLFRMFGFYVYPDTGSYLEGNWIRSRPYPIMAWITDAMNRPEILLWLQILLGAIAIALVVWLIWRRDRTLGVLIGLLLLLDQNWAISNRELLSEGIFMSFAVISLVVLAYQFERRDRLHAFALILAGLLFAWTCTIRPSNVYLLVPIASAYLVFTRSIPKTAWLSAGIVLMLVATSWLTLVQTGKFRIVGGTGYYVAFPLFSYHLFSPSNGPTSARIDGVLRTCDTNPDYSKVTVLTSNQYLWTDYFLCLRKRGWNGDQVDAAMTSAYVEAVRTHPLQWFESWGGWVAVELGYPVSEEPEPRTVACDPKALNLCSRMQQPPSDHTTLYWRVSTAERVVRRLTVPVRQADVYWLRVAAPHANRDVFDVMNAGSLSWIYVVLVSLAWCLIVAIAWFGTQGTIRVVALGAIATIGYVSATVPAGHVFLPRYVAVLTPMDAIVSAVVIVVAARFAVSTARRELQRRRSGPARV